MFVWDMWWSRAKNHTEVVLCSRQAVTATFSPMTAARGEQKQLWVMLFRPRIDHNSYFLHPWQLSHNFSQQVSTNLCSACFWTCSPKSCPGSTRATFLPTSDVTSTFFEKMNTLVPTRTFTRQSSTNNPKHRHMEHIELIPEPFKNHHQLIRTSSYHPHTIIQKSYGTIINPLQNRTTIIIINTS